MKLTTQAIAALGLMMLTAVPALALDPVRPPVEGFVITSETDMEVLGSATNNQNYNQRIFPLDEVSIVVTEDCCCCQQQPIYQGTFPLGTGSEIIYEDTNDAVFGSFRLVKSFAAHGQEEPSDDNLEASKVVGFASGASNTSLYKTVERAGLGICQPSGFGWTIADPPGEGPAAFCLATGGSSRQLAMGSEMEVTEVQANTQTGFNVLGGAGWRKPQHVTGYPASRSLLDAPSCQLIATDVRAPRPVQEIRGDPPATASAG